MMILPSSVATLGDRFQKALSDADRYAIREHGAPDAHWLRMADGLQFAPAFQRRNQDRRRFLHRLTRLVTYFF